MGVVISGDALLMARYGDIHKVSDFISRTIPERGSSRDLFAHRVIAFLQSLDAVQAENGWVTLTVHAGDGIWVSFQGRRIVLILPGQAFLRLVFEKNSRSEVRELLRTLRALKKENGAEDTTGDNSYQQWRVLAPGLSAFEQYFRGLPRLNEETVLASGEHPRLFPGPIRQAALENFERTGRWCPGVARRTKRHRVDLDVDRVEFDHVLPFAKGGASSALNIQVLCWTCNSIKRASAL